MLRNINSRDFLHGMVLDLVLISVAKKGAALSGFLEHYPFVRPLHFYIFIMDCLAFRKEGKRQQK
jgi:hypothetical protein